MNAKDFFHTYRDKVMGFFVDFFGNEELAKDLAQDIFLKIIQKESILWEVKDLDRYVFLMCRNRAFDHLKKASYDKKYKAYLLHQDPSIQQAEIDKVIDKEYYKNIIDSALNQLSDQQRLIFNLSKREGLSHQKIAEQLNISPSTVKNHLYEAMKSIRASTQLKMEIVLLLLSVFSL